MNQLRAALRADRGITLPEILVATAIISIGLVGLAIVIPLSSYGVHDGNALSTATFLAEQRLEEVRNAAWTTTPSANDCLGVGALEPTSSACTRTQPTACVSGTACITYPDELPVANYPNYSRNVRVTDCSTITCAGSPPNANLRLVRVTVWYRPISGVGGTAAGSAKSAVLELLVSRRL